MDRDYGYRERALSNSNNLSSPYLNVNKNPYYYSHPQKIKRRNINNFSHNNPLLLSKNSNNDNRGERYSYNPMDPVHNKSKLVSNAYRNPDLNDFERV